MSNFYPNGFSGVFVGNIDYDSDVMLAYLIRTGSGGGAGYAYNSAHSAIEDIEAYNRAGGNPSANLASKTVNASGSAFIIDAADTTIFTATAGDSGAVFHAYVIAKSGASEGQHILLTYNDLTTPITANGGNIILQHDLTGLGLIWANA